jgi:hypothetical protein
MPNDIFIFSPWYNNVPRPRPYRTEYYDSDTEEEKVDEGEVINALSENLLASTKETIHKQPSVKAAVKKMTQLPDEPIIKSMLRDSIKTRVRGLSNLAVERFQNLPEPKKKKTVNVSLQAMENFNAIVSYAHAKEYPGDGDPPTYFYCYTSGTYQVDDNKDSDKVNAGNPFLHLFDPDHDEKWEDPKTIAQVYQHN